MNPNKKMIASVMAMLVAGFTSPGCVFGKIGTERIPYGYEANVDEGRLAQIAFDLNWPKERIAELEQESASSRDYRVLLHAAWMLEHLEDKYGVAFTASDLSSPSIDGKVWRMRSSIEEGPYAGIIVTSRWIGGEANPTDDFISQARSAELEELLLDVLEEVYAQAEPNAQFSVFVSHSQAGDEATLATPVEELNEYVRPSARVYIPCDTKLGEQEYLDCATKLCDTLRSRGMHASFIMRRLLTGPSGESITLDKAQEVVWEGVRGRDFDMNIVGSENGWRE